LCHTLHKKLAPHSSSLGSESVLVTSVELGSAFLLVVSVIQQNEYKSELIKLEKSTKLPDSLQQLSPLVVTESIGRFEVSLLRLGGRLFNAQLNYSAKFPLLMPKGNRFVSLYIQQTVMQDPEHWLVLFANQYGS